MHWMVFKAVRHTEKNTNHKIWKLEATLVVFQTSFPHLQLSGAKWPCVDRCPWCPWCGRLHGTPDFHWCSFHAPHLPVGDLLTGMRWSWKWQLVHFSWSILGPILHHTFNLLLSLTEGHTSPSALRPSGCTQGHPAISHSADCWSVLFMTVCNQPKNQDCLPLHFLVSETIFKSMGGYLFWRVPAL